jgi:hypothetical protein
VSRLSIHIIQSSIQKAKPKMKEFEGLGHKFQVKKKKKKNKKKKKKKKKKIMGSITIMNYSKRKNLKHNRIT